jgi:hypothetical protein
VDDQGLRRDVPTDRISHQRLFNQSVTKDRLSVKQFAAVPALLDLPEIQREPASVSNVFSRLSSMRRSLDPGGLA